MKTIYDKIWESHVVSKEKNKPELLYIDLHLIHEVTSPQAFEGLRLAKRRVRRPNMTIGTIDHAIPTLNRNLPFNDPIAAKQVETLRRNAREFGVRIYDLDEPEQGIIHVFGPEQGMTQPGMTIVCGDSHTSTHGAFGALAFGIGTSEVEHVLTTQCLPQRKSKNFRIKINNQLPPGVTAKDLVLAIINEIGTDGATGHVIEYSGSAIDHLSMEARMTVCNMSIEAGAKAGLIAPDSKTYKYLKGKPYSPTGEVWERAVDHWRSLGSEEDAVFEREIEFDAKSIEPIVTWGTSPGMAAKIGECIPELSEGAGESERKSYLKALSYMALEPSQKITEILIDRAFIGSCTNARIEDLREAANVVKGYRVSDRVRAMVVPGSMQVKKQAECEGIAKIFVDAGFEWRDAGCSMCLGMNEDTLNEGERCASTSNRNFEGRQGKGGRTHLASPSMTAAAAIVGHFVDIREWKYN